MNENLSGSDALTKVFKGLGLEKSDSGYERLCYIIRINWEVVVTADQLRALEQQSPTHPIIQKMDDWPWMYASNKEREKFREVLRREAEQHGFYNITQENPPLGRPNRPLALDRFLDLKCQSRLLHAWWRSVFNEKDGIQARQPRPIRIFTTS
jgi:hypothetical protein